VEFPRGNTKVLAKVQCFGKELDGQRTAQPPFIPLLIPRFHLGN